MVARNAENAAAEGNRVMMRAGQLPSVSGYFNYYPWDRQVRADLPEPTTSTKLAYNLSLYQPLYHWGALQNNTRIGELQLRMAEGQTAEGYRILVQEIRALYLQLIIKKATLGKARLGLKMAEDTYAVSQTKLEKRVISDADMFVPTVNRDKGRLANDQAVEDFESSKAIFAKLCGAPVLSDDQIPDDIPELNSPAPDFTPLATSFTSQKELNSYTLRNMSDQIEVEKLTFENLNTRLRPKLNMVLGTSQDQQSYTTNIANKYEVRDYFAGVQVSWTLFDGFATQGAKTSSLARRRQLEQSYQDASANLSEQARRQLRLIGFARRGMDINDRLLLSATGAARDKKAAAARGLASDNEVNTYELNYHEMRINALAARSDYLMKNADFLSTLLEDPALSNLPAKP
jgi:outer membrane protein TolC